MKETYRKEHFTVPEGYFENFTEQMMAKLPEQSFQPVKVRRRGPMPRFAAAAAVAVVLVSAVAFYFSKQDVSQYDSNSAAVTTDVDEGNAEFSLEEAAHYAMMDNQDIHCLVAEQ